jgi:hypothetical protein
MLCAIFALLGLAAFIGAIRGAYDGGSLLPNLAAGFLGLSACVAFSYGAYRLAVIAWRTM